MNGSQFNNIKRKKFLKIKTDLIKKKNVPKDFFDNENKLYSFVWISDTPSETVLNLRNSEDVLINMFSKNKISLDEHREFLENYENLTRIDFMIKSQICNTFLGGVNLVYEQNKWQIGKYIGNKKFLKKGIAKRMTINLIEFFREFFPDIKEIFSITKSSNKVNIILNEKIGFIIFTKLKNEFILMRKEL